MTMKRKFGIVMLGLTVAAGGVGLVAAAEGQRGSERGERRGDWLAQELSLTAEQKASFKAMREQHQTEMQPLWEEGRALHEKLRAALQAENPDPQAVGEAAIAVEQHRKALEAAQTAFHERLAAQLTPEQKAKFDALAERHRTGNRGWGQGHHRAPETEAPASPRS
jgi:Spy/CpxP family protein refolding chaperone